MQLARDDEQAWHGMAFAQWHFCFVVWHCDLLSKERNIAVFQDEGCTTTRSDPIRSDPIRTTKRGNETGISQENRRNFEPPREGRLWLHVLLAPHLCSIWLFPLFIGRSCRRLF